jgi:hypothetical protein
VNRPQWCQQPGARRKRDCYGVAALATPLTGMPLNPMLDRRYDAA